MGRGPEPKQTYMIARLDTRYPQASEADYSRAKEGSGLTIIEGRR
jgi:hypothetical protein